jgi:hypothetical protein
MKRVTESHQFTFRFRATLLGPLARKLNGRFIRLRPRIAEKHLVRKRILHQPLGQLHMRLRMIKIADMRQLPCLRLHRRRPLRIRMTQGIHRNPRHKIQIFLAIRVIQIDPFPLRKHHFRPIVRVQHIILLALNNFLFVHRFSSK